jgi:hypothetical protein
MDMRFHWKRSGLLAIVLALALSGCGGAQSGGTTAHGGPRFFGGHPGQEETRARLSRRDCRALMALASRQTGRRLHRAGADPTPPNSHCFLAGPSTHVSISLDAAYAARQRYLNRMTEQVQFNAPDPAKIPHAVPGLGDRSAGEQFASWIPAYNTVFAVRGNRWVTVAFAADDPRIARRSGAIAVARAAFHLSAGRSGIG